MSNGFITSEKDKTRESAAPSEVIRVMTGNGLGFMFSRMSFSKKRPADWGRRLRKSFEELGPTYIKLGQMLTTRYDILPPGGAE